MVGFSLSTPDLRANNTNRLLICFFSDSNCLQRSSKNSLLSITRGMHPLRQKYRTATPRQRFLPWTTGILGIPLSFQSWRIWTMAVPYTFQNQSMPTLGQTGNKVFKHCGKLTATIRVQFSGLCKKKRHSICSRHWQLLIFQ